MNESPKYIGVKRDENGDPDFSHAAVLIPDKKDIETESHVEKQQWLDEHKEAAYKSLGDFLAEKSGNNCAELKKSLVAISRVMAPKEVASTLQPEDLDGIKLINYTLANANEVAGQEITRPVVLFPDYATFTRFATSIGQSSNGMNIMLDEGAFAGASLILSTPDRFFLGHEVMHSIDPGMANRKGTDKILDESLTFYYQCVIEGFNGFSIVEDTEERWKNFRVELFGYYEYAGEGLSRDEYKELVKKVVDKLQELQKTLGDIEVQRVIAKSTTLEELFNS